MMIGTLWILRNEMEDGKITRRDTTMTFTAFVMFDMFNALSCRSEKKMLHQIGFWSNRAFLFAVGASILGQLMVIYLPFFQRIFLTEALSVVDLLHILFLTSTVWWVDEARKWYAMHQNGRSTFYKALNV